MALVYGAQTERRGVPRPVRLPRGGKDAPAAFCSLLLFRVGVPIYKDAFPAKFDTIKADLF
jgi:hypothetical protein